MKLVVDSNVLISAFISDSTTRHLLRDVDAETYAPAKLEREVSKYDDLIQEKSGLSENELDRLKARLFNYVNFVDDEAIEPYRNEAGEAIGESDPDDVVFLATALARDATVWSDDADFEEQDVVPVVTTSELINRTRED